MPPPLPAATWAVTTAGSVLLGEIGLIVMFETVGGGTKPMPERLMSNDGLPASLLAMCKTAVFVPNVDALNCTVKVEVPLFAATGVVGEVVTEKLALFVPSMVTPVMSSGVLPVFVMVKVFESVLPTFTLPYATVLRPSVSEVAPCAKAICVVSVAVRTAKTGKLAVFAW